MVGPFPDKVFLLTLVDVFSRRAEAKLLVNKCSARVAGALQGWIGKLGSPKEILTDNGKEFLGKEFVSLCDKLNIKVLYGSPYTPTTTGSIERLNQSLVRKIRRLSEFNRLSWRSVLLHAIRAYNVSWCRAIDFALLEL